MAEENRKSILADILKKERLERAFRSEKDRSKDVQKPQGTVKLNESSSLGNSKDLQNKVENSLAYQAFNQALDEFSIDIRFYYLKEGEYAEKFRVLYLQHKSNLDKYGIDVRRFLDYTRESFDRFKRTKNLMPLDPMKPKSFDYIEKSIKDLIQLFSQKFNK